MSDSELHFPFEPKPVDFQRRIQVIRELMAQGLPEQTAAEYAVLIGDQPERDADGNVIVRNADGKELARVKLKSI